jgi:hypothetical protein
MKEIKTLKGFIIRPYSGSTYNCQTVEIFVSNDGVDYASIGRKTVTTLPAYHVFELKSSVLTQYLKFDLLRTTTGTCRIAEVEVY